MTYEEMMKNAKTCMGPYCKACESLQNQGNFVVTEEYAEIRCRDREQKEQGTMQFVIMINGRKFV